MKNKLHLIKIFTALAFLVIVNSSVFSQNVISSVNVSKSAKIISEKLTIDLHESEFEYNKSENWMSNISYLDNSSSLEFLKLKLELSHEVYETDRQIESWMINDDFWRVNTGTNEFNEESNGAIESWMLDEKFWRITSQEEDSPLEDWMTNEEFWLVAN